MHTPYQIAAALVALAGVALLCSCRAERRAGSEDVPSSGPTRRAAAVQSVDPAKIPLGDGKVSTQPAAGFVFACQSRFNGRGAFRDGPWINTDGTWDRTRKIFVQGEANWPHKLSVSLEGDTRVIASNGLPDHATGTFPIGSNEDAFLYDRNPNFIAAQDLRLELPANPSAARQSSCLPMGPIGVILSGAALFNALDAQGKDAVAHELQDSCHGHPEMTGLYHYHDDTPCLGDRGSNATALIGYALDGFGIYRETDRSRAALTGADLDECHGRIGAVEWDSKIVMMYHYVTSAEYPYTLGCFRGTPVRIQRP